MNQRPLQGLRLRDFRCFREQQTARLAPLTLLVGENSTGKTSFLAAVRAIIQIANTRGAPGFPGFRTPYDLGSFPEIAHRQGPDDHLGGAESFTIGIQWAGADVKSVAMDAALTIGDGAIPEVSHLLWSAGDVWIRAIRRGPERGTELGCASGIWRLPTLPSDLDLRYIDGGADWLDCILRGVDSRTLGELQPVYVNDRTLPSERDSLKLTELFAEIRMCSWARVPGSPIQSGPRRTYHPEQLEQEQVFSMPRSLALAHSRNPKRWQQLKRSIEEFGRTSGVLDEILIKRLGQGENVPFQLEVRKWGKKHKGAKHNLMDVGYGVSQVLSLLTQLSPDEDTLYLLQQPVRYISTQVPRLLSQPFSVRLRSRGVNSSSRLTASTLSIVYGWTSATERRD